MGGRKGVRSRKMSESGKMSGREKGNMKQESGRSGKTEWEGEKE